MRAECSARRPVDARARGRRRAAVGREDDRAGQAADPLLDVGAAWDRAAPVPFRRAVPATRAARLEQPAFRLAARRRARAGRPARRSPAPQATRASRMGFRTRSSTVGGLPRSRRPRARSATASDGSRSWTYRRRARSGPRRPPWRLPLGRRAVPRRGGERRTSATARRSASPNASTAVNPVSRRAPPTRRAPEWTRRRVARCGRLTHRADRAAAARRPAR